MAITYNGYKLSFVFILYIVISGIAGLAIIQGLYKNNKSLAAMLCLILLLLVFIFYGLRWFQNFQLKGTSNAAVVAASTANSGNCAVGPSSVSSGVNVNWPPIVNTCPDFMVSQNGKCIDPKQLYGNRSGGNGALNTQISIGNTKCSDYTIDYLRWEGVVESDGQCVSSKIPIRA